MKKMKTSLRNQDYDVLIRGDITSLAGLLSEGYALNSVSSGTSPWGLVFDSANENSPFSDLRVRQAISLNKRNSKYRSTKYCNCSTLKMK